jgi:putative aldouronate transport system substrate-binding protein
MAFIPPLKGPDGIAYTPYAVQVPAKIVAISSRCQNPELAFKIFEGFYDPAMSEIGRYGIEGVDFTKDPEICSQYSTAYIAIGLEEKVPRVILKNTWDNVETPTNSHWHNAHTTVDELSGPSMSANFGVFWDQSLPTAMIFAQNYLWYNKARP